MSAALGTLEQYSHRERTSLSNALSGLLQRVAEKFGCTHREMSRPFSRHGESYRVCIGCGAHRRFDPQTWNPLGPFYFKVANTSELLETNTSALKSV